MDERKSLSWGLTKLIQAFQFFRVTVSRTAMHADSHDRKNCCQQQVGAIAVYSIILNFVFHIFVSLSVDNFSLRKSATSPTCKTLVAISKTRQRIASADNFALGGQRTKTMKKLLLAPTVFFGLTVAHSFGQDTLVFHKTKNPDKQFNLPLDKYNVKIKTVNGKKIRAIITGYQDSTIIMRVLSLNMRDSVQRRKVEDLAKDTLTNEQYEQKFQLIQFAKKDSIKLSEIKFISIDSHNIQERKKLMKRLDLVGGLLIPAVIFNPLLKSPVVFISVETFALTFCTVYIIIEHKRINLKHKWSVDKLVIANK